MDCSIVGVNQRHVRVAVAGDILDLIKADKPIDVKALSLNMYNAMYEAKEKNNTEALAYARLVPFMVQQLMGADMNILQHVAKSKVDLNELMELQLEAQKPKSGLKSIEKWLGVDKTNKKKKLASKNSKKKSKTKPKADGVQASLAFNDPTLPVKVGDTVQVLTGKGDKMGVVAEDRGDTVKLEDGRIRKKKNVKLKIKTSVPIAQTKTIKQLVIESLEEDLKGEFVSEEAKKDIRNKIAQLKNEGKKKGQSNDDFLEEQHNQRQGEVDDWYQKKKDKIAEEELTLSKGSLETGAPDGNIDRGPLPTTVEEVMALSTEEFARWLITHDLIAKGLSTAVTRPYFGMGPKELDGVIDRILNNKTKKSNGELYASVALFYSEIAEMQRVNEEFPMMTGTGGMSLSPPLSEMIKLGLKSEKPDPTPEKPEKPAPTNKNPFQGKLKSIIDRVIAAFKAYTPSYLITSGNETGYTPTAKNERVPTPENKDAYAAQRNIIKMMEPGVDSSELVVNGRKGVFLTAKHIVDEKGNGRYRMVLTDKNGEDILFDENNEPSLYGTPRDYGMSMVGKLINEKGEVNANSEAFKARVDSLMALKEGNKKFTRAHAIETLKAEVLHLNSIREYIDQDKENNTLEFVISGGSLGYIQIGYSSAELTSVSKLTTDKNPNNPKEFLIRMEVSSTANPIGNDGWLYATSNEMEGDWIPIERPGLRDTPYVELIKSLLFDEKILDKNGNPINAIDRARHLEKYIAINKKGEVEFDYDVGTKRVTRLIVNGYTVIDTTKAIVNTGGKIINNTDIKSFKEYKKKSGGKNPKEFFTSKSTFTEFYNNDTGKQQTAPDSSTWLLQPNGRYDLVDKASGEVYISDVNLETGVQYLSTNTVRDLEGGKQAYDDLIQKNNDKAGKFPTFKMHVNQKALAETEFYAVTIEDGVLTTKVQNTRAHMADNNFKIQTPDVSSDGMIRKVNAFFTFKLSDRADKKINEDIIKEKEAVATANENESLPSIEEENDAAAAALDAQMKALRDKNKLNKTLDVKNEDREATAKQIKEARQWWDKHPLSKHISFKEMFATINQDGVAQWNLDGITLFKGSDYSDLYHEAWHGFTQTMLTKEQKTALYKEVAKKAGSFKAYNGRMVSFADANEQQLEEYLAEEFRNFMLKGKKGTTAGPKQLSFFKKILAVLKALFNNTSIDAAIMDSKSNSVVNELFEKMRVGDLSSYTFSEANANFGKLNQGITAIPGNDLIDGVESLNYQTSAELNDLMDGYLAEYVTVMNQGLDLKQQARLNEINEILNNKDEEGKQIYQSEERKLVEERRALIDNEYASHKFSSLITTDQDVLTTGYVYALGKFNALQASLSAEIKKEADPTKKANKIKDLKMIAFAIKQFGDTVDIYSNRNAEGTEAYGMVGYHMVKSKLFQDTQWDLLPEAMAEDASGPMAKRAFDRAGNESSLKDLASSEILFLLKTLPQLERSKDGKWEPVLNRFGVTERAPFQKIWNRMVRVTENTQDFDQMYAKLQTEAVKFPVIQELLDRLGDPRKSQVKTEHALWTQLFKTFSKSRVSLIQMTVEQNKNGTYESRTGEAFNADYAVGRNWQSQFTGADPSDFINNDERGNSMNLKAVIKAFPSSKHASDNPIAFLAAIGMPLSDNLEIKNELASNRSTYGIGFFWDEIVKLHSSKTRVTQLDQITKDSLGGRYKLLQRLEARYSDVFSNFMVTNAEGNAQFEHTLNNSMTMMVNAINNTVDYNSMIELPHLSHLDVSKSPFAKSSLWLKAMFNLTGSSDINADNYNPNYGERRYNSTGEYVTLRLTNLSGVLTKRAGEESGTGVSSASADEYSKLIMDLQLSYDGMPELMRHADKGTSFAITIDGALEIGGSSTDNYIPIGLFAPQKVDGKTIEPFRAKTVERLSPHIIAELERMRILETMVDKDGVPKMDTPFDPDYIQNGRDFVAFEDALSDSTKDALKKVAFGNPGLTKAQANILIAEKVESMREVINTDLTKYFNKQYEDVNSKLDDAYFLADNTKEDMRRNGITGDTREAAVRSFVHNSWIHNIESIALVYGDLAQYNHAKEGFHKRNAGAGSTGDIYRHDDTMIRHINNDYYDSSYAAKHAKRLKIKERRKYGSVMSTAIIEDQDIKSVYLEEYKEAFGDDWNKADGYGSQNEGDAQGLIQFDAYRELKVAEGTWSNEQNALFEKIVNGEKVSTKDVAQFFPVIKAQYWGPLANDTELTIQSFHKYSLFPMIPTVIKGKKMEKLHDKMVKEGIGYLTFESGSKVGTITKKAKTKKDSEGNVVISRDYDKVYGENQSLNENIFDPTLEDEDGNYIEYFTKNDIYLQYLKNQLEIHDERKGNVIFSTQLRKLIEDGLMTNGVPTDFMYKESLGKEKDLAKRVAAWKKLGVFDKSGKLIDDSKMIAKSSKYALLKDYENNIDRLTQYAKDKLLEEINWSSKMVNGREELTGDMENLLDMVRSELTRQDLGQHSIDFIQTNKDGTIKNDLSLSLGVEQIEKLLNAMLVKKLLKQKVNGEGLIQVAATLMEDMAAEQGRDFKNPTEEDLAKYGSKDLPHYRKGKGKDGKTTAAKVKVALAGDFKYLLNMPSVKEKAQEDDIIQKAKALNQDPRLTALNTLIKDEEWLNEGRNREMISMIGVRIPVQGMNSMEFMEVYEFLPEEAGSIIVPPTEIVTKSGADFDVDKMTVMMPNILNLNGSVELATTGLAKKSKETLKKERDDLYNEIDSIRNEHRESRKDKETKFTDQERDILSDTKDRIRTERIKIKGLKAQWLTASRQYKSPSVVKRMKSLEASIDAAQFKKTSLEETESMYYNTLPNDRLRHTLAKPEEKLAEIQRQLASISDKSIQNDIMNNIREILSLPENFKSLVMPNSTELLTGEKDKDGLSQEMEPHVMDNNKLDNVMSDKRYKGPKGDRISGTRVLEVGYNLYKHTSNNIGKQTLGLGAVDNTYNTLFNRIGAYMNPSTHSRKDYDAALTQEFNDKDKLTERQKNILKTYTEQKLRLNHNTIGVKSATSISLSNEFGTDGTPISDVVNQLINGWVDIAADAFVFNLQGNKEVSPVLLFMVQAGVPIDEAVYFVSNPLVRQYVKEQKLANSTYGAALGTAPMMTVKVNGQDVEVPAPQMARHTARGIVLNRAGIAEDGNKRTILETARQRLGRTDGSLKSNGKFSKTQLKKHAKQKMNSFEATEFDRDVFIHFLEIENMSDGVKAMKMRTNVDTSKDATLFAAQDRITMINQIKSEGQFPAEMVDKIQNESPISSFFIQEFQIALLGDMFPLRNHAAINQFIQDVSFDDWKDTYGIKDKAIINWKSDLINYAFQNELKYFNIDKLTHYNNRRLVSAPVATQPAQTPTLNSDAVVTPVRGGAVTILKDAFTDKQSEDYINKVENLLATEQNKESNFDNEAKQVAVVYGPKEYSYAKGGKDSQGNKRMAIHNIKAIPQWMQDLSRKVEKDLGKPEGYYNHVLINRYGDDVGIGTHTDAESIYDNEKGEVGSVAIYSIGHTKNKHKIGGVDFQATHNSLAEMSTGKLSHSVGKAKGVRYSINFRHIPPSQLGTKTAPQSNEVGTSIEDVFLTRYGAYVKDGKMYIDRAQLRLDYENKSFTQKPVTKEMYAREIAKAKAANREPKYMNLTAPVLGIAFETEQEYIQFVLEREVLREERPLSTVINSSKFMRSVDRTKYDNKIKEDQTNDEWAEWIVSMAYENYLRDEALTKTFNHYQLFKSENTFAHEFVRIKKAYPSLKTSFDLMNLLDFKDKNGWKNLALNQSELDEDQLNVLHENLEDLTSGSKLREILPEASQIEIDEIIQYFESFPIVAFMQSGMSQNSQFSLTSFVSQDKMVALLEKPLKNLEKLLDSNSGLKEIYLDRYHAKWRNKNSAASRDGRVRGKNMTDNITLLDSSTIRRSTNTTTPEQRMTTLDYTPSKVDANGYDSRGLTLSSAKKLLEDNPKKSFVYDYAITNQTNATQGNRALHGGKNAMGLSTLYMYSQGSKGGVRQDLIRDVNGEIAADVKEAIDHDIDEMVKAQESGQQLIFDKAGYGQYMLSNSLADSLAPRTFLYLSKQLLERVQFVNPGYLKTQTGKVEVQAGQAVTDASIWQDVRNEISTDEVRDFIKQCL